VAAHGTEESTRDGGSRGGSKAHMRKVCAGEGETHGRAGREGMCTGASRGGVSVRPWNWRHGRDARAEKEARGTRTLDIM
jgi:hypothetical protein